MSAGKYLPTFLLGLCEFGDENITDFRNVGTYLAVIQHNILEDFYILFTVHLSTFILVINQLDAQNLFYTKFISCLYVFRASCAHRQEVKIVLYTLWYHHTYRCDDTRVCIIHF